MWRKPSEAYSDDLAAADPYTHQVPLDRAIPMWGGISQHGFAKVFFHPTKKVSTEEWVETVTKGSLKGALEELNPQKPNGPWTILCDGEKFLHAGSSQDAYRKDRISTMKIPPRSPDLNPVEQYWSWLRRKLISMDLQDLAQKRRTLSKFAYKQRINAVVKSAASKRVAGNIANSFRKVCQRVVSRNGGAGRG